MPSERAALVEAATMLAVVPDRRRWLREHPVEVVVVVLTPPFRIERELSAADEHLMRELRAMRGQLDALETAVRSRH